MKNALISRRLIKAAIALVILVYFVEKTRENLFKATGREFKIPKNLSHTSDVIFHHREEIAQKAKRKLVNAYTGEPLKVVEHIGCHYAKIFPKKGVGGSEFPYVLAGMHLRTAPHGTRCSFQVQESCR